jgi:hypothetical protein
MLGPNELLIILALCAALAFVLWGIADAVRRPPAAWRAAGVSMTMAIVLQVLLGPLGTLLYLLTVRPRLVRAAG